MISDDVFIKELDEYLKIQGFLKKKRKEIICNKLKDIKKEFRDKYLENERIEADNFKKKPIIPTEDTEQIDFVEWFRKTYTDVVIIAIWNGGSRSLTERSKQIAMGLHPGAADLFVPAWGLWIEMKRTKGGKWSEEQVKFHDYVKSFGDIYMLGIGFEDAKEKVLAFVKNNLTK